MRKRRYYIDASGFTSRSDVHAKLKAVFTRSEYYGSNLDALHDVLTSLDRYSAVTVFGLEASRPALGAYADSLRAVFTDSANENPRLTVIFTEPEE